MICSGYVDVPGEKVQMEGAKGVVMRIVAGPDQGAPNFTMRVFTVSPGGHTPLHTHDFEHEIFFYKGTAQVVCEGESCMAESGFYTLIPPGALHQFKNAGNDDLVFVCVIPNR